MPYSYLQSCQSCIKCPMKERSQTACSHLPRCTVAVAAPRRLPNPCFLAAPLVTRASPAPSQERVPLQQRRNCSATWPRHDAAILQLCILVATSVVHTVWVLQLHWPEPACLLHSHQTHSASSHFQKGMHKAVVHFVLSSPDASALQWGRQVQHGAASHHSASDMRHAGYAMHVKPPLYLTCCSCSLIRYKAA